MLEIRIIRRSVCPWASPLHMVQKPAGGWRSCGDCRRLNSITEANRYAILHVQDFSAHLTGATIFFRCPCQREDAPKTAVITPFGRLEFLRMPFGLKNAAQIFQRLMDTICLPFDFVFVYLDDILLAGSTQAEPKNHLQLLFQLLAIFDLEVNMDKCQFVRGQIEFLSHLINQHGARSLLSKFKSVQAFPYPTML